MKNFIFVLLVLILTDLSAQNKLDFIELSDGDTLIGNVWSIDDNSLRFQPSGSTKTSVVSVGVVKSYSQMGEVFFPHLKVSEEFVSLKLAEQNLHWAGKRLVASSNTFYTGSAIIVLGSIASIVGAVLQTNTVTNDDKTGRVLTYIGAGAAGVGGIITITAFIPIAEAGKTLQNIKLER